MIVPQQSAEPLTTLHWLPGIQIGCRWPSDESISEALMVPFEKVMLDMLSDYVPKLPLTEWHNSVETLGANRFQPLSESPC